ncbi:MAG: hypothetical protein NTY07_02350 [Bacteroidia bacterium]|nr:hypothetical protein [Bacteroidia bacterium]
MKFLNLSAIGLMMLILVVSCKSEKKTVEAFNTKKMLEYCVAKTKKSMNSLSEADSLPRNICLGMLTKLQKIPQF